MHCLDLLETFKRLIEVIDIVKILDCTPTKLHSLSLNVNNMIVVLNTSMLVLIKNPEFLYNICFTFACLAHFNPFSQEFFNHI